MKKIICLSLLTFCSVSFSQNTVFSDDAIPNLSMFDDVLLFEGCGRYLRDNLDEAMGYAMLEAQMEKADTDTLNRIKDYVLNNSQNTSVFCPKMIQIELYLRIKYGKESDKKMTAYRESLISDLEKKLGIVWKHCLNKSGKVVNDSISQCNDFLRELSKIPLSKVFNDILK